MPWLLTVPVKVGVAAAVPVAIVDVVARVVVALELLAVLTPGVRCPSLAVRVPWFVPARPDAEKLVIDVDVIVESCRGHAVDPPSAPDSPRRDDWKPTI